MVSMRTRYLGLDLEHPFICGASPFGRDVDSARKIEDGGAAAIVMPSLFEEQILKDQKGLAVELEKYNESFPESVTFFPPVTDLKVGPQNYLDMVRKTKETVSIPVVASLNGMTEEGWMNYAVMLEQAGADAVELNIYHSPLECENTGCDPDGKTKRIVKTVTDKVKIPVAVKLFQHHSCLPILSSELVKECGAAGVVLFNRFLDADVNIETFDVEPKSSISSESELFPRMVWASVIHHCAAAHGHNISVAVSGGVHSDEGAVKAVLAGADAVQMVSEVMLNGPGVFAQKRDFLAKYMEKKEYKDYSEIRGAMSYEKSPNAAAYQRLNYLRLMMTYDY